MNSAVILPLLVLAAAWAADPLAEPAFADPDPAILFDRLAPCFAECAGPPDPRLVRSAPDNTAPFTAARPAQVMPVGAGRLSAMVLYGDRLELHLSRTGLYARTGENPWVSPGHVAIRIPGAAAADLRGFSQRLDLLRGAVAIDLTTADGTIGIEVAGDRATDCLSVAVDDRRSGATTAIGMVYEGWRPGASITATAGRLVVAEPFTATRAEPHQRAQSQAIAVALECRGAPSTVDGAGTITVSRSGAGSFELLIAVADAQGGPPVQEALARLAQAAMRSPAERRAERMAWWRSFWSRSWIDLEGPDGRRLSRLWATTLYSYACVGAGRVPPKFNGGPGLVHQDARSWGEGFWWQNQREIIWPMDAAGHPEFARQHFLFYSRGFPAMLQAARRWGQDGALLAEWVTPALWPGRIGDPPPERLAAPPYLRGQVDPAAALARRSGPEFRNGGYTSHIFSGGPELVLLMLDHVRFTGDRRFLEDIATPWLKAVAANAISLLTLGADGRYHARFADANEQWWRIDDAASLLAAIRSVLLPVVGHGAELGCEADLIADARDRLERLAPLPTVAAWGCTRAAESRGVLDQPVPGDAVFAPFDLKAGVEAKNSENPELYAVFPFALADLHSDDALLGRARATFRRRAYPNAASWSQCPVQAARLGLTETVAVILDHAQRHQRWPYGGWNSPGGSLHVGSAVTECPYFDGAGVNMTAVQEMLLQSHPAPGIRIGLAEGGPVRILPAVAAGLSGRFLLHARGGVAVRCSFRDGRPELIRCDATRDVALEIANPFTRARIWRNGAAATVADGRMVRLPLAAGEHATIAPAEGP